MGGRRRAAGRRGGGPGGGPGLVRAAGRPGPRRAGPGRGGNGGGRHPRGLLDGGPRPRRLHHHLELGGRRRRRRPGVRSDRRGGLPDRAGEAGRRQHAPLSVLPAVVCGHGLQRRPDRELLGAQARRGHLLGDQRMPPVPTDGVLSRDRPHPPRAVPLRQAALVDLPRRAQPAQPVQHLLHEPPGIGAGNAAAMRHRHRGADADAGELRRLRGRRLRRQPRLRRRHIFLSSDRPLRRECRRVLVRVRRLPTECRLPPQHASQRDRLHRSDRRLPQAGQHRPGPGAQSAGRLLRHRPQHRLRHPSGRLRRQLGHQHRHGGAGPHHQSRRMPAVPGDALRTPQPRRMPRQRPDRPTHNDRHKRQPAKERSRDQNRAASRLPEQGRRRLGRPCSRFRLSGSAPGPADLEHPELHRPGHSQHQGQAGGPVGLRQHFTGAGAEHRKGSGAVFPDPLDPVRDDGTPLLLLSGSRIALACGRSDRFERYRRQVPD